MNVERWSPFLKTKKLIEEVRLFSLPLAGEYQIVLRCGGKSKRKLPRCWRWAKIGLVQNPLASFAFCSVETKQKEAVFPRILHRWSHAKILFISLLNSTEDVKRVVKKKYILDVVFVVEKNF